MVHYIFQFAQETVNTSNLPPSGNASAGEIRTVLDIVFTVTGALALLIITIAGFRYILSRGDPSATAQAREAILYACVGLVVSIAAYTIVAFVANSV
jgi:hypothetical protein